MIARIECALTINTVEYKTKCLNEYADAQRIDRAIFILFSKKRSDIFKASLAFTCVTFAVCIFRVF